MCVEVRLNTGSIWFWRTVRWTASGGWSGRGDTGVVGWVWYSGASGEARTVMKWKMYLYGAAVRAGSIVRRVAVDRSKWITLAGEIARLHCDRDDED